jgi:hypothetical protein
MPIMKLDDVALYPKIGKLDPGVERLALGLAGRDSKKLQLDSHDLPADSARTHHGYADYLRQSYADHIPIVIEPNHLWHLLLCELAQVVTASPAAYHDLFADTSNKTTIRLPQGTHVLDVTTLMAHLRHYVPTDVDAFLPVFSTDTERSTVAKYAAFAEMSSPYYDYGVCACGFPAIDVRGEQDDWERMASTWFKLVPLFPSEWEWLYRVSRILDGCAGDWSAPSWWHQMYRHERCGSGSDVEMAGWFPKLFRKDQTGAMPRTAPACVSEVRYTADGFGPETRFFRMRHGLMASRWEGKFLVPDFGHILHEEIPNALPG